MRNLLIVGSIAVATALGATALFVGRDLLLPGPVPVVTVPVGPAELPLEPLPTCPELLRDPRVEDFLVRIGQEPPADPEALCAEEAEREKTVPATPVTGAVAVEDPVLFAGLDEMSAADLVATDLFPMAPGRTGPAPEDGVPVSEVECTCRWATNVFETPDVIRTRSFPPGPPNFGPGITARGERYSLGASHASEESMSTGCGTRDRHSSAEGGDVVVQAKVVCHPKDCCEPRGYVYVFSFYRSVVSADSEATGDCLFRADEGRAFAADAVDLYVLGARIPWGSDAVLVTSGPSQPRTVEIGVGSDLLDGPGEPPLSGEGRATPTVGAGGSVATGSVLGQIYRIGFAEVFRPGATAELQSGAVTAVDARNLARAAASQRTIIGVLALLGEETSCGAGAFDVYEGRYDSGDLVGIFENDEFRLFIASLRRLIGPPPPPPPLPLPGPGPLPGQPGSGEPL